MTRCREFYEELEKDGNFCGMRDKDFSQAITFWKGVKKDKDENPSKTCDAWVTEQRGLNAKEDTKKTEDLYNKKTLNNADFAKEVNNFIIWCFEQREEEVIREEIDKAYDTFERTGMPEGALKYLEIVKANSTFVEFSEGAIRPLIHEKDPEVQQKVISSVENAGKQKGAEKNIFFFCYPLLLMIR